MTNGSTVMLRDLRAGWDFVGIQNKQCNRNTI